MVDSATETTKLTEAEAAAAAQSPATPPELIKIEKNLATIGFFTPSSKRIKDIAEKTITITTSIGGKRAEFKGSIIPSKKYGLPNTADQDKMFAVLEIVNDILQREGVFTNPLGFTSADILRLLGKHRHSGKNYKEVEDFIDAVFSTTIFSEGIVFFAGTKKRGKDRYRIWDRAVTAGRELPDGTIADKHYVWFSDWQLENINKHYLLFINRESYRHLKNHISKALIPPLFVWKYATQESGRFEKRYEELCELFGLRQYRYLSDIKLQWRPSLDELTREHHLVGWSIEKTTDGKGYKIIFLHQPQQAKDAAGQLPELSDRPTAGEQGSAGASAPQPAPETVPRRLEDTIATASPEEGLLAAFERNHISREDAQALLAQTKPGQLVLDQIEYFEFLKAFRPDKQYGPGYLVRLIQKNAHIPDNLGFISTRQKRDRALARQAAQERTRELEQLDQAYLNYRRQAIDSYVNKLPPGEYERRIDAELQALLKLHQLAVPASQYHPARRTVRDDIANQLGLLTFDQWRVAQVQPIAGTTADQPRPHVTPADPTPIRPGDPEISPDAATPTAQPSTAEAATNLPHALPPADTVAPGQGSGQAGETLPTAGVPPAASSPPAPAAPPHPTIPSPPPPFATDPL